VTHWAPKLFAMYPTHNDPCITIVVSTRIKPGKLQKIKTVFKFKDLELKVYFLHMDCNLVQYKESWRGGQRRTLTVKIRADLQEN
jgi:hypothetical protein